MGFRRDCPPAALLSLIAQAERRAGVRATALATPAEKAAALRVLTASLALPVLAIAAPALRAVQPRCPTRSAAALRRIGVASVAEGAALAAAGLGAKLILPRIANPQATCAIAVAS